MFIGNANILGRRTDGSIVYLLDTYTAAAAYSLRQLKTGVTSVVRVRRSGDNAESDFTADEVSDGTLLSWVTASGTFGSVVTWYDQSGGGNDITQSTASNQPRIVASGVVQVFGNGSGLNFSSASSHHLNLGSGLSALSSEPFTWFAGTKGTSTSNYSTIFNTGSGATANSRFECFDAVHTSAVSSQVKNTGGTVYTISPTSLNVSQEYIRSGIVDSSKGIEDFADGTSMGTVNFTGTYVNDVFTVGANTNISRYFQGVIGELIIFNTDESANQTAIESDINGHYSIY